ncbi:glutamyl-tRNA(Gln) amidotransferase subunit B, mitochondrial [Galendromus occidentalis]|uniref:Glutamyl-tRNA(Gln) amidotransferase subunit B, mitochondrial n=1 Tax=Galendromus occidentalis TaxID=34638 RepID=A0AAJ6QT56_9ACAR|nr:glutamyl-tRNA(Gln) amidotransferase subunit B, mitochondrial [Galendromus occidentalis]
MILKATLLRSARVWPLKRNLSSDLKGVVGLEVHVQIASKSKLFSSAPTAPGPANSQVAPFDAAIPGTLPVLNRQCVEAAVKTALALNCREINQIMRFDRKHYFYADMPAGFQITQQFHPVARKGLLTCQIQRHPTAKPEAIRCRVHQIQLEQDSGKSIHDENANVSLIDLNRAGVGLLEIVFKPDLSSGEDAAALVKELVAIVRALGVSTGRMEEGAVRVDANVSVHRPGTPLGTRTEIKNMNSVRSVRHAIDYEIKRQIRSVESGIPVANVTMTFDTESDKTVVMRDKEITQDYRFFPEPNIPSVDVKQMGINVDRLRNTLPPLPGEQREDLMQRLGLSFRAAMVITSEENFFEFFSEVLLILDSKHAGDAEYVLTCDVLGYLNEKSLSLYQTEVTAQNFAKLILLKATRKVNRQRCSNIIRLMLEDGTDPEEILEKNNWSLIADTTLISRLCDEAISLYPKECNKLRQGKERAANKMLAHVRRATDSRADMVLVKKILLERIHAANALRDEIQIGR